MNLSLFDQSREKEQSTYGEAVRLSNEFRAKPARTIINVLGERVDIPARNGFDVETCEVSKIDEWLAMPNKKSQSQITFLLRIMCLRFPDSYATAKRNLSSDLTTELELIESLAKNEIEWFGEVGYQNMVRLDGSLTIKNIEVINKNDTITAKRKP